MNFTTQLGTIEDTDASAKFGAKSFYDAFAKDNTEENIPMNVV